MALGADSLTRGPGHQERGTWPSRAGSRTAASRVWSRARGRGCVGGHVPEPELDAVGQGPPDLRRTALGRFLRECLESLDRPHVAGVPAPAHLPRVVGPASGRVAVVVVEALVGGDPVDGAAHPRVVQVGELITLKIRLPVRQGMTLPWRPPTALAQLTEKPPDSRTLDMVRSFTQSEQAADPVALAEPGCIAAGQRLAGPLIELGAALLKGRPVGSSVYGATL
jgi:hypothetical protein